MKFECDSCHAQYMIADEKVGKRGVKVKCKRCAHVIIVRPAGAAAAKKDDPVDDGAADPETTEPQRAADPLPPPAGDEAPAKGPAPIAMNMQDQTLVAKPPQMSFDAPRGDPDATELGGPPQPTSGAFAGFGAESPEPALRPAMAARPAPAPAPAPAAFAAPAPAPSTPDAGALLDDQIAGAFSNMFADAPVTSDPTIDESQRGPTKVLDFDHMNALRKQIAQPDPNEGLDSLRGALGGPTLEESGLNPWKSGGGNGASNGSPVDGADDGPATSEWHVAIDEQDTGPLTLAEMGRHIEAGRVDRDSLVWKTGMDDWVPASDVPSIRALFDKVPMPKIGFEDAIGRPAGGRSFESGGGLGGLDVGSPIDDLPPSPMSGGPPGLDDPFSGGGDNNTDPSWRPHGLTDVYQAANLAELATQGAQQAAGLGSGALVSSAASKASLGGALGGAGAGEPEWRPSAASALSSLVSDEINRIESGPPPAADDDLSLPPAADDNSLSTPFSSLGRGDLDAGPDVAAQNAARTSSRPSQPAYGGAEMAPPSYPPPAYAPPAMPFAPPSSGRPSWFVPAIIGGGLVVLLLLVMFGVLIAAVLRPNSGPAVAANVPPPVVAPAVPGAPAPVATPTPTPAPVAAVPTPAPTPTPEAVAPTPAPAPEPGDDPAPIKKASSGGVKPTPPKPPRPTPPPPEPVKPPKGGKGCDILDPGCEAGGSSGGGGDTKTVLSKNDVLVVIMKSKGSVEACGAKHGVSGVVKMKWEVANTGKTREVQVADAQYAGTPVGNCLVSAIKGWKFPAYSGAPIPPVTFPFKLKG